MKKKCNFFAVFFKIWKSKEFLTLSLIGSTFLFGVISGLASERTTRSEKLQLKSEIVSADNHFSLETSLDDPSPAEQVKSTISGKVTDATGASLPGVSVVVKGTTTGVITDKSGDYSINVPVNATLQFSFVGMKMQEVTVGGKTTINVKLEEETVGIEEVVAIGYGIQKKSDITGSVASISSDAFAGKSMVSLEQGLQGKAAGVRVSQTSSEPGGNVSIRIRGGNSINAGNEPLYVIDGFVGAGNLNTINPNDIESIEVLKDASATSIYGARGANGVVLISTKRGKAGENNYDFTANYGFQQITKTLDLMNGQQFAELANEAAINTNNVIRYPDLTKISNTDWQNSIYQTSPVQSYSLTASGGVERVKYVLSSEYFDQKGVLINSGFNRYSFRANIDLKLSEKIKFGAYITTSRTKKSNTNDTGGQFGPVRYALESSPAEPIYNAEGNYNLNSKVSDGVLYNPVAQVTESINDGYNTRVLSNLIIEYSITKGLIFKSSLGIDLNNSKNNAYEPKTTYTGRTENSIATISHNTSYNLLNENLFNFSKGFNNHRIDLLGGFTIQKNGGEWFSASTKNYALDLLTYNDLGAGATVLTPSSGAVESQLVSFLGRANYVYNDKYLFTITGRYDGSSKFGSGNKFVFFPSAALAWRLNQEDFISNLNVFSNFKLRVSIGKSGSQEINSYQALASMVSSRIPFNGMPNVGFVNGKLANPNLRWETTAQTDLGIDMAFLNNRLRLTLDTYYKKTTDLLLIKNIPSTSGFTTSFENIGNLENKGIEFDLGGDILSGKVNWSSDFNISANKNKVLDLGPNQFIYAGADAGGMKLGTSGYIEVGKEIGQIIGYKTDGIYQTTDEVAASAEKNYAKPGSLKILDYNADGKIDILDRVVLGSATPKFFFGFTNHISYNNLSLDFFISGTHGNKLINYNAFVLSNPNGGTNVYADLVNRWTGPGTSDKYPKAGSIVQSYIYDYYVEDASYIRLKYVTLSYNLNKATLQSLKLKNAKLYVTGQDLLTFTNYSGYNPETNFGGDSTTSFGGDYNAFPSSRTVIVGINIGF
jgi:TonB-linked SusC/RagA family outer membrane protein